RGSARRFVPPWRPRSLGRGLLTVRGRSPGAPRRCRRSPADRARLPGPRGTNGTYGYGTVDRRAGMAAFRVPGRSGIRAAYGLDAFWCDANGLYLHGWAHAHEHRVRALAVECAGRSARVDTFADRPDLLAHYPEHEHVRHAGFTVYLACPPGHPVRL